MKEVEITSERRLSGKSHPMASKIQDKQQANGHSRPDKFICMRCILAEWEWVFPVKASHLSVNSWVIFGFSRSSKTCIETGKSLRCRFHGWRRLARRCDGNCGLNWREQTSMAHFYLRCFSDMRTPCYPQCLTEARNEAKSQLSWKSSEVEYPLAHRGHQWHVCCAWSPYKKMLCNARRCPTKFCERH